LFILKVRFFFRHVYNYCTNNASQSKSVSTSNTKNSLNRVVGQEGANIAGEELYNKLKGYLRDYLEDICKVSY